MERKRKKTWQDKAKLVQDSFARIEYQTGFSRHFYENLFFLKADLKEYFVDTDFEHQEKALMQGIKVLVNYLKLEDELAKTQLRRLSITHNHNNLKIHPHNYYYWIEALILTLKQKDPQWFDDLEYYWKECISFPIAFMISQYFLDEKIN